MPDNDLLAGLARFEKQLFPRYEETYRRLVNEGQHPKTLFIGCSDSRLVPYPSGNIVASRASATSMPSRFHRTENTVS